MASENQTTPKLKKKDSILRKYAIYLFIPLPAVLGMIGFLQEGEAVDESFIPPFNFEGLL